MLTGPSSPSLTNAPRAPMRGTFCQPVPEVFTNTSVTTGSGPTQVKFPIWHVIGSPAGGQPAIGPLACSAAVNTGRIRLVRGGHDERYLRRRFPRRGPTRYRFVGAVMPRPDVSPPGDFRVGHGACRWRPRDGSSGRGGSCPEKERQATRDAILRCGRIQARHSTQLHLRLLRRHLRYLEDVPEVREVAEADHHRHAGKLTIASLALK